MEPQSFQSIATPAQISLSLCFEEEPSFKAGPVKCARRGPIVLAPAVPQIGSLPTYGILSNLYGVPRICEIARTSLRWKALLRWNGGCRQNLLLKIGK